MRAIQATPVIAPRLKFLLQQSERRIKIKVGNQGPGLCRTGMHSLQQLGMQLAQLGGAGVVLGQQLADVGQRLLRLSALLVGERLDLQRHAL